MLPKEYPQQHFVFAGTRDLRDEEKQDERDTLRRIPRRIWWAVLLGVVVWPLCIWALVGLYRLLHHSDDSVPQMWIMVPAIAGVCAVPIIALTLLSEIRKDWRTAKERLKVEQVEHWDRRPDAELDEEDEETWDLPLWVEVVANTTTIWDEEYDDYEDGDDEEPDAGGSPWSGGKSSPWND